MEYPIYKAVIQDNDDTAMFAVSLVSEPAVEKDFLFFSKEEKKLTFAVENEEKHIVTGLIMSADTPIIRLDADGNPYYIVFDAETVKIMARKFLKNGFNNNVDLNHNFEYIEGVELTELYIKDIERGISPKGFEDVKDGSLFGTYFVKDEQVWNAIKDGTFKGFSIEVTCTVEEDDSEYNEVLELIKEIKNKLNKK